MERLVVTSLSVIAIALAATTSTDALTERFDDARQQTINKVNNRFVDTHQNILIK